MYKINFKMLLENLKNGLETIAQPFIPFNLADIKNKEYSFILDSYTIKKEELDKKRVLVSVVGKVLKPCNLKTDDFESGSFIFGLVCGQVKTELVELNFENKIDILSDVSKISYGFGVMQVVNFTGFAYTDLIFENQETEGTINEVHASLINDIIENDKQEIIVETQQQPQPQPKI